MQNLIALFIWLPFGYGCFAAWAAIKNDDPEVPAWQLWATAVGCFGFTLGLASLPGWLGL